MLGIQFHSNLPSASLCLHSGLSARCLIIYHSRYLQDAFQVPLIIMLTDDEKFYHSDKLSIKECKNFALQNAMDIIAIGFDIEKTFIFADTEFIYGGQGLDFAHNLMAIGKKTTNNQIKGTFGFTDT